MSTTTGRPRSAADGWHLPRSAAAAGVALLLLTTAGCGAPSTSEQGAADEPALAARAAGADASQVEILQDGTVTYDEYESAMNRSFECMRERGFEVRVKGTVPSNGVTLLDYEVEGTSSGTDLESESARALIEECRTTWSTEVDRFWQVSSPDAIAYAERRDAAIKPIMRACLEKHDVDLPDDATMLDMIHAATDLQSKDEGADCITESGYTTWKG
ncbi:hypothetical protein [Cellulomonas sp. S1-8]|uniref:hypothetical protein n=1 Tax=Cellulomonas sp. S1-8 TaxID=2904790 RepID=UPI002242C784|nr:hypothetical protein [Cellulomonas sp. S1-8]UZN03888.1 hypothetical protein OKX07_02805 [Cellulomonas sp. S1-8]